MKRITTILLCFFCLISLPAFISAVDDLTPATTGILTIGDQSFTITDPQSTAGISRIESKVDAIKISAAQCFKASDIDRLKQELNEDFDQKISVVLGRMVSILIVFTVFFFSSLFLSKGKGWL